MTSTPFDGAESAYAYPLLIRQLLLTPLAVNPEQQIVYRDRARYTYRMLRDRVGRLASALRAIGIGPGDTVAIMDWDSNRYLEAYFAVPMMGAVLMTANVRLAPEQIAYTLNHSRAKALLVNTEFMPVLDARTSSSFLHRSISTARRQRSMRAAGRLRWRVRVVARCGVAGLHVRGFRREYARDDLLHHGHDRPTEGRLFQSPPTRLAHAFSCGGAVERAATGTHPP